MVVKRPSVAPGYINHYCPGLSFPGEFFSALLGAEAGELARVELSTRISEMQIYWV